MVYGFAKLDSSQLAAIQKLEQELGKRVLALQEYGLPIAEVTPEELQKVTELETELGLTLLVVK